MIFELIKILIIQVLAIFYSKFEGEREAYYYFSASKIGDSSKYNIHWLFYIQRGLFVVACSFIMIPSWHMIMNIASIVFSFSFFHDGFYYIERHKLTSTLYLDGFKSNSITSTARQEYTFRARTILFLIGSILFLISELLCYLNY